MICVYCNRRKANRPRQLCWSCYYTPGVRESSQMIRSDSTRRPPTADYNGPSKLPVDSTQATPGSEEKIAVMEERALRGESLWHPDDGAAEDEVEKRAS